MITNSTLFEKIFKNSNGIREINYLEDWKLRKDWTYEFLVKQLFFNSEAKKRLLGIVDKYDCITTSDLAFSSYIYALNHKWEKALECMEKVIELEKWENIDSWMDYGHFLRKIPKYQNESNNLLLNIKTYMQKYKNNYWKINIIKLLWMI